MPFIAVRQEQHNCRMLVANSGVNYLRIFVNIGSKSQRSPTSANDLRNGNYTGKSYNLNFCHSLRVKYSFLSFLIRNIYSSEYSESASPVFSVLQHPIMIYNTTISSKNKLKIEYYFWQRYSAIVFLLQIFDLTTRIEL